MNDASALTYKKMREYESLHMNLWEKLRSINETKNYYWNSAWGFFNLMLRTWEPSVLCCHFSVTSSFCPREWFHWLWVLRNREFCLWFEQTWGWHIQAPADESWEQDRGTVLQGKKGREKQFCFDQFTYRQTKAHNLFSFTELLLFYWLKYQFQVFFTKTYLSEKNMKDLLLEY